MWLQAHTSVGYLPLRLILMALRVNQNGHSGLTNDGVHSLHLVSMMMSTLKIMKG